MMFRDDAKRMPGPLRKSQSIAFVLALLWLTFPALAQKKLALVIGNDGYQNIDRLQKAKADAKSYAAVLRDKGFNVQEGYDLSGADMSGAPGAERASASGRTMASPTRTSVVTFSSAMRRQVSAAS